MKITASDYDRHILDQGAQVQIDTYYEPKKAADQRRIDIVLDHLEPGPGEKILDIGCGVGTFVFHSAKRGSAAFGIDYSQESLKMAKGLAARYPLKGAAHFVLGQAFRLPFVQAGFDKITAIDFIEHIDDGEKDALLSEMARVLKDEGRMVIFTPNKIREDIGAVYWKVRRLLFKDKVPQNVLHYGLIRRASFERLLKKHGLAYEFHFYDVTRPFLAQWPLLRHLLGLNLMWIVTKRRGK